MSRLADKESWKVVGHVMVEEGTFHSPFSALGRSASICMLYFQVPWARQGAHWPGVGM